MDSAFHHTYVMKLFDRSVDLAQFQEDTPLYPICRAWMANQPRNPNLVPKYVLKYSKFQCFKETLMWFSKLFLFFRARSPSPEIVSEANSYDNLFDSNGEIRDIGTLPPPLPSEEAFPRNRIPSPIHFEREELNLDYVSIE